MRVELVGDLLPLRESAFQRLPVLTTCFHTRRKLRHDREAGKTRARPVTTWTKWDDAAVPRVTDQFLTRGSGHKHVAVELRGLRRRAEVFAYRFRPANSWPRCPYDVEVAPWRVILLLDSDEQFRRSAWLRR
jgi:hypothetical protein